MSINGTFYGGSIYSITPSGQEKTLYTSSGGGDGTQVVGGLLAYDGALYGTSATNGTL